MTNASVARLNDKAFNDLGLVWDVAYLFISAVWLVLGVGGNTLILLSVIIFDELRTIPMVLAANLAVSDLSVSAANVFTTWVALVYERSFFLDHPVSCIICGYICGLGCTSSLVSVCNIAVNRYTSICHPAHYSLIYNKLTAPFFILLTYIGGLVVMLPAVVGFQDAGWSFDRRQLVCLRSYLTETGYHWMQWWETAGFIGLPLGILSYTYFRVFQTVHESGKAANRQRTATFSKRDIVLMKTLIIMIVTVYGMFFPWTLLVSFDFNDKAPHWMYYIVIWLVHSASCVNPFIYAAKIPQFQRSFRKIFRFVSCGKLYAEVNLEASKITSLNVGSSNIQAETV